MSFLDFFKVKRLVTTTAWKELGAYTARFYSFGRDLYNSDIVRACIRPIAEHTSKANARSSNRHLERLLNTAPNMYMNGKDFLAKVRTRLELTNTVFIYISRDDTGAPEGFYPIPYRSYEGIEYNGRLYVRFTFGGDAEREMVVPWADLAVLRKDYNKYDIGGDENDALLGMLDIISTTNQGIANAVKATANLRGILKSTKGMLSPEDRKKQKEEFIRDYLNLENEGGIASLDSTQEFTPITMNPTVISWEQQKEFRENVYRYFGISDAIVMSDYTEAQMEAFYDSRIEPFLVALSIELTRKCFSPRERAFGSGITYESNRINFASTATKLSMVALVDRGALTPNEWRAMFNLAPVEGGDLPLRRLDTEQVTPDPQPDDDQDEPDDTDDTQTEPEGEDNGDQQ